MKLNPIFSTQLLVSLFLVSCAAADMKSDGRAGLVQKPKPEGPPSSEDVEKPEDFGGVNGGNSNLSPPEYSLTPALVVKKANCVMCHAKVQGDVITDFNHGARPMESRATAFATPSLVTEKVLIETDDGMRPRNWNTASIDGTLAVLDFEIKDKLLASFEGATPGFSSLRALTSRILNLSENELKLSANGTANIVNIGKSRDKSKPGVNEIQGYKTLKIDPPTADEIKALVSQPGLTELPGSTQGLKIVALSEGSSIEGLSVKSGTRSIPYAINSSRLKCKGDIGIGGSLVLKDAGEVELLGRSCRLYVQKAIFINGDLKSPANSKLGIQLAAGEAVMAGVAFARYASASVILEARNAVNDIKDVRPLYGLFAQIGGKPTMVASSNHIWVALPERYPSNNAEVNAAADAFANIKTDATHWNWFGARPNVNGCTFNIGPYVANPNNLSTCFVAFYSSHDPKLLENASFKGSMDGLLIATPNFHSRYTGNYKGVIVADFVLGSLDRLDFVADKRFAGVSILPKLNRPIVTIAK